MRRKNTTKTREVGDCLTYIECLISINEKRNVKHKILSYVYNYV